MFAEDLARWADWARVPSDGGPWVTLSDDEGGIHVFLDYGETHLMAAACWCHPRNDSGVIVHHVAH